MNVLVVIILILTALLAACLGFGCFYLNEERKKAEKEKEAIINAEKAKTETKESMETGDDSADFDTSVNILHELVKASHRGNSS